jgi:hypothetical protein
VKGEKIKNSVTGAMEDADERMMREVEGFSACLARKNEDYRAA